MQSAGNPSNTSWQGLCSSSNSTADAIAKCSNRAGGAAILRDGRNPDRLGNVSIRDVCMNNESMIPQCQTDSTARDISNLSSGLPSIAEVAPPDDILSVWDHPSHSVEALAPPHVGGTNSLVHMFIVLVLDACDFGKSLSSPVLVKAFDIERHSERAFAALPSQYLFTISSNGGGLDADVAKRSIFAVELSAVWGINNRR